MFTFLRKHPVGAGTAAIAVTAAVAWLAFGFFGVHTLFVDDVVDEAAPVFDAGPAPAAVAADVRRPSTATQPVEPVAGTEPETSSTSAAESPSTAAPGDATAEPDAPAATTPVGADPAPETAPTPEIMTELSGTFESDAHPTSGTAVVLGNGTGQRFLRLEGFATDNGPDLNVYLVNSSTGDVSDVIDLGDLKGNIGDQNYEIPEGVDLTVYDEVRIWCVRFGVGFGTAALAPA